MTHDDGDDGDDEESAERSAPSTHCLFDMIVLWVGTGSFARQEDKNNE
jgi:hypothetical protein